MVALIVLVLQVPVIDLAPRSPLELARMPSPRVLVIRGHWNRGKTDRSSVDTDDFGKNKHSIDFLIELMGKYG